VTVAIVTFIFARLATEKEGSSRCIAIVFFFIATLLKKKVKLSSPFSSF
jgi:hypothetical protein